MQCPNCRAETVAGAEFCPHCGAAIGTVAAGPAVVYPTASAPGASGMSDNAAGAIAYLTIIPAIIFLVLEPYSKNRFVRFHSFQCIALTVVSVIGQIGILIMQTVLHFIPVISFLIGSIVSLVFGLLIFIAWLIAIIKASQGVKYKLPFIGDYAEKLADGGSL